MILEQNTKKQKEVGYVHQKNQATLMWNGIMFIGEQEASATVCFRFEIYLLLISESYM